MDPIYLDHAATTPIRPEVREAILPYLGARFGNPSSSHSWGREARVSLEEARERVAEALGAARREIVFTSGGTEADNLAVLGRWRTVHGAPGGAAGAAGTGPAPGAADGGDPPSIACSAVEHKAVLGAVAAARRDGALALLLAVDEDGRLDTGALDEALAARPAVVSVMWANNEVGTIQPVEEVAERCAEAGLSFHSDAVQAFGKVPVRVDRVPVSLLSISAHKIGGPKGVGALYVRDGGELEPLVHGGSQERGLRPGTENVALVVGFAVAAELAAREQADEARRLAALRDRLESALLQQIAGARVNGGGAPRLPNILNIAIPGVARDALLMSLDLEGLAASTGSACQTGVPEPSHVLLAMGRASPGETAVRFSLGRTSTAEEIERAVAVVPRVVERVRGIG